ncbi:hypothetical protein JCM1840_004172 [Sporobolomyces johnsonii]
MRRKIVLTLHRYDLRVHDQALFHAAHSQHHRDVTHVLPLYVYDERFIELSGLPGYVRQGPPARTRLCGFWRTSGVRVRFTTEAVFDLRNSLRRLGSDLLIRFGKLEDVTDAIVRQLKANGDDVREVFFQKEFYSEELAIERKLRKKLEAQGVQLRMFDQAPLINVEDLPFPVSQMPDVFTPFRKRVEALPRLGRDPLPTPSTFKSFPTVSGLSSSSSEPYASYGSDFDQTTSPHDVLRYLLSPLEDDVQTTERGTRMDERTAFPYQAGETSALERLEWYFKEGNPPPVAHYKETRNGLLGHAYSTKMSPFLSIGMISPRLILQALVQHEEQYSQTQNTYWVRFELLWRDYFLYTARKFGTKLFTIGGFEEVTDPKQAKGKVSWWKPWEPNAGPDHPAVRWMEGRTGVPFIDANMAELRYSGFMSNRGRQNVASFLTKDCQLDWRIGAEFFESHLIDFEASANWGNWQYVGGVGNDPRASRQFNPIKQGNDYDPHGEYIKTWLPQLASVPAQRIQCPWVLSPADRARYLPDPSAYPLEPVLEQPSWKPHYTRRGPSKQGVPNRNERVRGGAPAGAGAGGAGLRREQTRSGGSGSEGETLVKRAAQRGSVGKENAAR